MISPLNPTTPAEAQAQGFVAPYLRTATHIGFNIAVLAKLTDDEWNTARDNHQSEDHAMMEMYNDLTEASNHIDFNVAPPYEADAFVSPETVAHIITFKDMLDEYRESLRHLSRAEALSQLEILSNNLAYVGAAYERDVSGNASASEGRNH